jgi:hypothetical protein
MCAQDPEDYLDPQQNPHGSHHPSRTQFFVPEYASKLSLSPLPCPGPPAPVQRAGARCGKCQKFISPLPCPGPPAPVQKAGARCGKCQKFISPLPCPGQPAPVQRAGARPHHAVPGREGAGLRQLRGDTRGPGGP